MLLDPYSLQMYQVIRAAAIFFFSVLDMHADRIDVR